MPTLRMWIRIIIAVAINCLLIGLLLNSYWLSLLYTKGFYYFFTTRIVNYSILIPIQLVLMPYLISISRMLAARIPWLTKD